MGGGVTKGLLLVLSQQAAGLEGSSRWGMSGCVTRGLLLLLLLILH